MSRVIDDNTYFKYLLASLNVDGLKKLCKDFEIKGYSKLKKSALIDYILGSLSEEEIKDVIDQKEYELINSEIELAIKKIKGIERESISSIKITNEKKHELEISFKGFNWDTTSYLSINPENINDPERDCDCRIGANMGFCSHFWVGFIFSLKKKFFDLADWNLTIIPENFEKKIENLKIKEPSSDEKTGVSIIDEDSDEAMLSRYNGAAVTIYEGTIIDIIERQSEFQENITTYYHVSLENVRLGPRIKKQSDFNKKDVIELSSMKIRISEKLFSENDLKKAIRVKLNGKLDKDSFWGYLIKNIRKIEFL